ncbi:hypothetical protein [Stenotrophomonas sp. UBA7606]|uniref:hypothetical protein n=1 Tax=Stenotrophomonas sp. UBA7606 TaxID=1947559 RepID=UPI003BEEE79D
MFHHVRACSIGPAIHGNALDGRQVQVLDATQVDGGSLATIGGSAQPEWLATTGAAELMLDHMAVERIGAQRGFTLPDMQGLARYEPKQEALAAAMGAIAFVSLLRVAFTREAHRTTMATTGNHGLPHQAGHIGDGPSVRSINRLGQPGSCTGRQIGIPPQAIRFHQIHKVVV